MAQVDPTLRDDPRVRDPVAWNRLKLMVMDEACDRAWGCSLYRMHRNGLIDNEQREAGDKYHKIIADYINTQQVDPDEKVTTQDYWLKKIERSRQRRDEVVALLGIGRGLLDSLILHDEYPSTPRQKVFVRAMLQALSIFFKTGRKKAYWSVV